MFVYAGQTAQNLLSMSRITRARIQIWRSKERAEWLASNRLSRQGPNPAKTELERKMPEYKIQPMNIRRSLCDLYPGGPYHDDFWQLG